MLQKQVVVAYSERDDYWYDKAFCNDKTFDLKPQQPRYWMLTSLELSRQFNPG